MSKNALLKASQRTLSNRGAIKELRRQGNVPAVIYGNNKQPETLQVSRRSVEVLFSHSAGEHFLVDLEIEGDSKRTALMQDVQRHPVDGQILHLDFLEVSKDTKITAKVSIEPKGTAAGVRNAGGVLDQLIWEVEIECLPQDLPEFISVDVTELKVGDSILIRDITFPEGVVSAISGEISVFHVLAPRVDTSAAEGEEEKKAEG